jgi:hypothetical protein
MLGTEKGYTSGTLEKREGLAERREGEATEIQVKSEHGMPCPYERLAAD